MNNYQRLDKLNHDLQNAETKLRLARHKEKILEHQVKALTRKERTHRLCTRGAMLESYLPHPEALTDEQINAILKKLFQKDDIKQSVGTILAESQKGETV